MSKDEPVLIVGGGLRGGLAALALAARRPDVPFLILEQSYRFGGGQVPPFFTSGLSDPGRRLVDSLIVGAWDGFYLATPGASLAREGGIAYLVPEQIHAEMVDVLRPDQYRLNARVERFDGMRAVLSDGGQIAAAFVLDARGRMARPGASSGWCHVMTRIFDFAGPHELDRPIVADATLSLPGWSFLQYFPLSPTCLMIRYVRYSASRDAVALNDGGEASGAGTLVTQYLSLFPLAGPPVVEMPADPQLRFARAPAASRLHPLLPSPVAAATAFALDFAALPFGRPELLAVELFRREAEQFKVTAADVLVNPWCSEHSDEIVAKLHALASLGPPAFATVGR